ncbi:acyl-CoA dehydrogenase, N-terminal domain protein [Mycobacterium avium subsp. avium 2285 (R)]|nr:acyl-CoA dehydrogenase, N-terminal domain protein [Mycobacterium avium subsp. avium 2285 (R)]
MSAPVDSALHSGRHLEYLSSIAAYREDFRRYLRDLKTADEWRAAAFTSAEDGLAHDATVMASLNADGWNRYGWPEAAGGLGGNEIHRAVYYEELGHAMLPIPAQHWTLETLGPALLKFAPGLAAAYLPGYLSGVEWWGQSFSEPESGSDLASLRTRAVDDGAGGSSSTVRRSGPAKGPPPRACWRWSGPGHPRAATAG